MVRKIFYESSFSSKTTVCLALLAAMIVASWFFVKDTKSSYQTLPVSPGKLANTPPDRTGNHEIFALSKLETNDFLIQAENETVNGSIRQTSAVFLSNQEKSISHNRDLELRPIWEIWGDPAKYPAVKLTLHEAIRVGLVGNLDLQIEQIGPEIARADILEATGAI